MYCIPTSVRRNASYPFDAASSVSTGLALCCIVTPSVMSDKFAFSTAEDEALVESVQNNRVIHDSSHQKHKDAFFKENIWKTISEEVGRSSDDCKKRWKNIKDTYQKRQKKGKGSRSFVFSKAKPWPLAEKLTFLDKADRKCKIISNIECDVFSDHFSEMNEDWTVEETKYQLTQHTENTAGENSKRGSIPASILQESPPSKRIKYNEKVLHTRDDRINERNDIARNMMQNHEDEVDVFFKSIAMSVKKLNPELVNEAKMKSLQMVFDLEKRNASDVFRQPHAS